MEHACSECLNCGEIILMLATKVRNHTHDSLRKKLEGSEEKGWVKGWVKGKHIMPEKCLKSQTKENPDMLWQIYKQVFANNIHINLKYNSEASSYFQIIQNSQTWIDDKTNTGRVVLISEKFTKLKLLILFWRHSAYHFYAMNITDKHETQWVWHI